MINFRILFFFTLLVVLLFTTYRFLRNRLLHPIENEQLKNTIRWGILLILLITIVPISLNKLVPSLYFQNWFRGLLYVSYLGIGFITLILSYFFAWVPLEKIWFYREDKKNKESKNFDPRRRHFFQNSINLGLLALTTGTSGLAESQIDQKPAIVKVPLEAKIPLDHKDLSFVQISDVHLGLSTDITFIDDLVDQVNALRPDFLAITGDMVDGNVFQLKDQVDKLMKIKTRYGIYFVSGNHEYYSNINEWYTYLKKLGIKVLHNQFEIINHHGFKLLIGGVPDYMTDPDSNPVKSISLLKERVDFKLLLAHQPMNYKEAQKAGYDLMVCGHTHAGQYWPATELIKIIQPFVSGMGSYKGLKVYVNSGTGYWGPPMRLATRSEITQFSFT